MFLSSTVAYIIALTSPGPDTAIIIKQCSAFGRRAGIFTAIGIGFGILIHCILAASGISLIILNYPALKVLISMIGGSYIFYIGASMYISNDNKISSSQNSKNNFVVGFITNLFNIKAFIFFVSLFSILSKSLNGIYFYIYPLYFAASTILWFSFLSILITSKRFQYVNIYNNIYIKSLFSIILCFIGLFIIFTSTYEYLKFNR